MELDKLDLIQHWDPISGSNTQQKTRARGRIHSDVSGTKFTKNQKQKVIHDTRNFIHQDNSV